MKQYIDLMTPMEAYEKGYNKAMAQLADMTEECKQMGRQEVVESIGDYFSELIRIADILKDHNWSTALVIDSLLNINRGWQAKLKKWGIKDD